MQNYIWLRLCGGLSATGQDKRAQDLIEYALLAAFIAVAVAAFFPADIAPSICSIFSKITGRLNQAPG